MSKLDLGQVHVFDKIPGTHQFAIKKAQPALRLSSNGEVVYIQHGKFWTAGGLPIPERDLPGWVKDELGKCNPKALAEAGYVKALPAAKPLKKVVLDPPQPTVE